MTVSKHLFVLRHAHSAKARPGQEDYDRDLDDRGHAEAERVRQWMASQDLKPDRVTCSGALRTRATLAAQDLREVPVRFADDLYSGSVATYLSHACSFEGAASGMLVGHNPMVVEFVASLAGKGDDEAMRRLSDGMPPGTLAVIEVGKPFAELAPGDGFLRHLFVSKV